jgi:hypothetical protein
MDSFSTRQTGAAAAAAAAIHSADGHFASVNQKRSFYQDRLGTNIPVGNIELFCRCGGGHCGGKLPHARPRLAVIEGAERVELSNFTTNNSGYWNLVVLESSDVHIHHVRVRNPSGVLKRLTPFSFFFSVFVSSSRRYPEPVLSYCLALFNKRLKEGCVLRCAGGKGECGGPQHQAGECFGPNADGMDLVSVSRALVEHNDIISGDDAICIKSGEKYSAIFNRCRQPPICVSSS